MTWWHVIGALGVLAVGAWLWLRDMADDFVAKMNARRSGVE